MIDRNILSQIGRKEVASDPLYFDLCGFEGTAPSVASYYDFLVRLWQSSQELHVSRKLKNKRFTAKPKKKLKQNEKLPSRKPGSVKRLVAKAMDGNLRNFSLNASCRSF